MAKRDECVGCPLEDIQDSGGEVPFQRGEEHGIMIVGQSPARKEIAFRKVFSGVSGQLLRRVIHEVGLVPSAITMANALKCAEGIPGLKGKNLATALRQCRRHLLQTIDVVKPRLIVAMGANALKTLTNKGNVSANRGTFIHDPEFDCPIFVTVHPAAVMRGGTPDYPSKEFGSMTPIEKTFLSDWRTIRSVVDNDYRIINPISFEHYREATLEDLERYLMGPFAFDIETTGLNWRNADTRILSIGFSNSPGVAHVVLLNTATPEVIAKVSDILQSPSDKFVAARPFDEKFISAKLGITVKGKIHDVLVMAHLKDENYHAFNLETVASIYAGMDNIKDVAEGQRHLLETADPQLVIRYQGVDADATWRSAQALIDECRSPYYRHFILPVMTMFSSTIEEGCLVDTRILSRNTEIAEATAANLASSFLELVPEPIREKHIVKGYSLTRTAFVRDVLFSKDGLGIKPDPNFVTETTKEPQLTEDHLKLLRARPNLSTMGDRALTILMDWKKIHKIISSYLRTLPEYIHEDNRIYPSTSLTRTVTGRTVMLSPPIQTFPSRGENANLIKEAIIADPGYSLMTFDLAQSELRIMGWLAHDREILQALHDGTDLHTLTAAKVRKVGIHEVTEEMRQLAKGVNFGLIYGMQTQNFMEYLRDNYNITLSYEECSQIRNEFFHTYRGVAQYHARIQRVVRKEGMVESPLGRIRHLPSAFSPDYKDQSEAARQAINSPIQSFSSDLGLIAMMILHEWIKKEGIDAGVMWFIHDAVILQVNDKQVIPMYRAIKDIVEVKVAEYILSHFKLEIGYPIACDVKVGKSWASMIKYHKWVDQDADANFLIF